MHDTFARGRTRPEGQARASKGYLVYKYFKLHAELYARYLCSRDALGLKARDDRVSCIQHAELYAIYLGLKAEAAAWPGARATLGYIAYNMQNSISHQD